MTLFPPAKLVAGHSDLASVRVRRSDFADTEERVENLAFATATVSTDANKNWTRLQQDAVDAADEILLNVIIIAVVLSIFAGVILGLVSGYIGGWLDRILVVVADAIYAFPSLLLAIVMAIVISLG